MIRIELILSYNNKVSELQENSSQILFKSYSTNLKKVGDTMDYVARADYASKHFLKIRIDCDQKTYDLRFA